MKISHRACARTVVAFCVGLLFGCGGSYGGGGGRTPATLNISVNPATITVGQSATITWSSNGDSCTASGAWAGAKAGSGSEQVTPITAGTYTYSLTCRGGGYGESNEGSTVLTVNPTMMAGMWIGDACCVGANSFSVSGATNDAGDYGFLLLDTHFVGKLDQAPAAYAISRSSLAGQRKADAPAFAVLDILPRASVRERIRTSGAEGQVVDFSIPYGLSFERSPGIMRLAGTFTSHLGTGYTLTITIDDMGHVIGSDTHGCRLDGRASTRNSTVNSYEVVLDVNDCGSADGRYAGLAAVVGEAAGNRSGLFLSASNAGSAIGWQLD